MAAWMYAIDEGRIRRNIAPEGEKSEWKYLEKFSKVAHELVTCREHSLPIYGKQVT